MQSVRRQIESLARAAVPILIVGETGTGKELCAEAIAGLSGLEPFVPLNCAAVPESLVESELFGSERGAYTGAVRTHPGLVAAANGGILFLDELGEIPLAVQAKLLRTLDSGEYRRLGSTETRHSEFRILAAMNGDPERLVTAGRLRQDFLYRIGAARIYVPPLRQRSEDIPLLAEAFLIRYLQRCGSGPSRISPQACALLMQDGWPGNVRQLRNVVEASAAVAGDAGEVGVVHVLEFLAEPPRAAEPGDEILSLSQARARAERRSILEALRRTEGNRERAAKMLRISEATLYRKLANGHGLRLGNGRPLAGRNNGSTGSGGDSQI